MLGTPKTGQAPRALLGLIGLAALGSADSEVEKPLSRGLSCQRLAFAAFETHEKQIRQWDPAPRVQRPGSQDEDTADSPSTGCEDRMLVARKRVLLSTTTPCLHRQSTSSSRCPLHASKPRPTDTTHATCETITAQVHTVTGRLEDLRCGTS